MTSNMNEAQASKKNAQEFRRQVTTLHQAAIGVMQVRTKEPFRAIDALRDLAFADDMEFRLWTILQGWETFNKTKPTEDPTVDNCADAFAALKVITGLGGGKEFPDKGIYVMMHAHKPLAQHIGMIQIVKNYAKTFTSGQRRLILLTPFSFTLPEELQDDVVIVDFDPPSFAELKESLLRMIEDIPQEKRPRYTQAEIEQIVSNGAGMTKQEFDNAVARALVTKRTLLPNIPIADMANIVGDVKTEVVKRSEILELMEPTPMERIGGLDNLKEWIVKRKPAFSQEARDFGVDAPKGIALIGPPGTGKTASAKAIASVLGIPLLKFDVGRVFNSLVGQSEARAREATKLVESMAPCVLMIDEADKAFQVGSGGDSGVGQRVLGTILTWMQETKSPIFTVVTANRVENLPSEFLRKGRLDEVWSVTTPNEVERLEIMKIHLRLRKQDPSKITGLEEAVVNSAGYVSSELEGAVKDAIIEAYSTGQPVTGKLIVDQLSFMVPLSEAFKEQFQRMEEWATNNARAASRKEGEELGTRVRKRTQATTSQSVVGNTARATNLDS